MGILLPGLIPRGERLVRATRDFDRKRISRLELEQALGADVEDLRRLQEGFPYLSPGLFNWQDLLRPFSEIVPGCTAGGLQRFYETNTFWRTLEFPADAGLDESRSGEWIDRYFFAGGLFAEDEPMVFTLPFPFLFHRYSRGLSLRQATGLLGEVAGRLGRFKAKALCLFEPGFGYLEPTGEEKRLVIEFLEELKGRIEAPVYVVSSFFPLGDSADFFFGLPADGFGVDLYANSLDDVLGRMPSGKALLAGVLNTDSTFIESAGAIRGLVERIRAEVGADDVFLTPSGPAELLPRAVLEAKVANLREALS